MLFLFFQSLKADVLADILLDTKNKIGGPSARLIAFFIALGGLALCIFGIKYQTISLTAMSAICITQIMSVIVANVSTGQFFGITMPTALQNSAKDIIAAMDGNKVIYWGVILLIALLASWILISFIHTITLVVILILIGVSYSGGYHERLFVFLGVENQILKYILLSLVFMVLVFLYFKIPKIILAILFAFVGSAMTVYGIDTLLNLGWDTLEMFSSTVHGKFDTNPTAMFAWMLTFALGLGIQFVTAFSWKS